jgi:hypothetical protein
MTAWRRNLALYCLVGVPVYLATAATVDSLADGGVSRGFLRTLSDWVILGWIFPFCFLPAALALVVVANRLPTGWPAQQRRLATIGVAVLLFGAELALLVFSPAVLATRFGLITCLPAAAYGAVLRLRARAAV